MKLVTVLLVVFIIVFMLLLPFHMGKWCAHNTELLASHYMEKSITMPRFPFILGAYFTQAGLPYGIITEVWCQIIDIK